jgi:cell division protein FtsB
MRIDEIVGKYMMESAEKVAAVQKKIEKLKKQLQGRPAKENFGEKEVRDLSDSIHMEEYTREEHKKVQKMIDEFDDWCINYTGK